MPAPEQLERCLTGLFDADKRSRFPHEWGLTFRASDRVFRIGYYTNLTPATVDQAILQKVDFILTHHDAWSFLYGMPEACARDRNARNRQCLLPSAA